MSDLQQLKRTIAAENTVSCVLFVDVSSGCFLLFSCGKECELYELHDSNKVILNTNCNRAVRSQSSCFLQKPKGKAFAFQVAIQFCWTWPAGKPSEFPRAFIVHI